VKPWLKPSETPYTLTNAKIIDTVNGKLLEGTHSITIKNGVIASIAADGQGSGADEGTRIDVGGKFVSPGLIDAHVHVTAVPGVNVSLVS
jgi:adenine deaminase